MEVEKGEGLADTVGWVGLKNKCATTDEEGSLLCDLGVLSRTWGQDLGTLRKARLFQGGGSTTGGVRKEGEWPERTGVSFLPYPCISGQAGLGPVRGVGTPHSSREGGGESQHMPGCMQRGSRAGWRPRAVGSCPLGECQGGEEKGSLENSRYMV